MLKRFGKYLKNMFKKKISGSQSDKDALYAAEAKRARKLARNKKRDS